MLVVGLATALAITLGTGTASAKPVLLQDTSSSGPDAYTSSPTKAPPPAAASTGPSASASATSSNGAKTVSGAAAGLYGGTENVSSCDVNQLSDFLTAHPDKGKAWAGVEGIAQADIPAYLHSLTPVVLRTDTRVTNHGFSNGQATTFQSVLQAGTAVLVDSHGVPRARCACGNPLLPPAAQSSEKFTGTAWSGFRPQNVVVVQPAPVQITVIVLFDPTTGQYFGRPTGGTGHGDHKVPPPTGSSTSPSSSTSSSGSGSSSTSPSTSCATGSASGSESPCPSGSTSGNVTSSTSTSPLTSTTTGSGETTTSNPTSPPTSAPIGTTSPPVPTATGTGS
ncbi:conserved hypothetical protein [Catenulispora acidiphila DSM 44928]|uniref:DUF6777 domain-containing protein n=1 Tax=Catenulispora acidiphila (strain DSM 44928 / JCM 14897 / NBRC 102108 / NRRL B-24433 / ID139908) TaxID=479433 RepID=C7Q6Y3_CATAD|nr:conserved hypothetical protein [Catenulispora acidiphila DSM 44928]